MTEQSKPTTQDKQDRDKENKSSREIEKDIYETRNAISDDIKSLSDKLSPAHLKEEAKSAVVDATHAAADQALEVKDAIVEKAVVVKDAVVENAVEVKEAAIEKLDEARDAVVETMENVGDEARRIGTATWRFTAAKRRAPCSPRCRRRLVDRE